MAEGKILPYLDVPFQHASPRILKLMKRPASAEKSARAHPRLARDLPRHHHPQHLHRRLSRRDRGRVRGAARSSSRRRSSTASAASPIRRSRARPRTSLPGALPEEVKRGAARALHAGAGADQRRPPAGARSERPIRCWSTSRGLGRSSADAPEIDGVVHFKGGKTGEFVKVTDRSCRRARSLRETAMSNEVVVVSGVRTAIGDYGMTLKDFPATKLGAIAIKEAVARAKIDPATRRPRGDGQRDPRRGARHVPVARRRDRRRPAGGHALPDGEPAVRLRACRRSSRRCST